jgi:diacylglycerol kinase
MKRQPRSHSRLHSFRHAFAGWWHVLRTQQNAWIHLVATLVVILLGILFDLHAIEWAVLAVAIGLVWTAEFVNTALEAVVDLASPEQHPLARVGKDVGAAAVLISAAIAFIVGLLIFLPPLWAALF